MRNASAISYINYLVSKYLPRFLAIDSAATRDHEQHVPEQPQRGLGVERTSHDASDKSAAARRGVRPGDSWRTVADRSSLTCGRATNIRHRPAVPRAQRAKNPRGIIRMHR